MVWKNSLKGERLNEIAAKEIYPKITFNGKSNLLHQPHCQCSDYDVLLVRDVWKSAENV